MRIDKLHLQDFGQFHEMDLTLAPGINVVYGNNEAGKTTIKDFIVDMLYGIDKARGIGARFDHYEQRKPINGSAFSGSMEVSVEGADYLIERNFARQEKRTTVRDLDSGREISLQEENNLLGTLLQTDKSTYTNT
ncbi:MAG: AAA family ATPase [Lachnospiraceae bacterium]|nr:AAA family ATPase [Lachnospiraceae bacterium]